MKTISYYGMVLSLATTMMCTFMIAGEVFNNGFWHVMSVSIPLWFVISAANYRQEK
jgi:hypothetical protein